MNFVVEGKDWQIEGPIGDSYIRPYAVIIDIPQAETDYTVDSDTAAICHCILLLRDSINELSIPKTK